MKRDLLKKALAYMRPYRRSLAWGVVLLLATNLSQLAIPWYTKHAVDGIAEHADTRTLGVAVLAIAIAAIIQAIVRIASRNELFGIGRSVEFDIRDRMYAYLLRQDPAFYESNAVGDLISRASNDLGAVRLLFGFGALNLINTIFAYTTTLAMMLVLSPSLTLYALAPMPLMFFVLRKFGHLMHARFLELQEQLGAMSTFLQESVQGMDVIQAFNQQKGFLSSFDRHNRENYRVNMSLARMRGVMTPIMIFVAGIGSFVVLYFGGRAVIRQEISLGTFVAFQGYLGMLVWPTLALGYLFNVIQRGLAGFERVYVLLGEPTENDLSAASAHARASEAAEAAARGAGQAAPRIARLQPAPQPLPIADNRLTLDALTVIRTDPGGKRPPFQLGPLSMHADAGEWVGVAGDTGSGKSTLLKAVAGYVPVTTGTVTLGGVMLTGVVQDRLFTVLGYVPQAPILFGLTIRENLSFRDNPGGDERLWEILQAVELADEIRAIAQGLSARLGEGGITLSGGQRQRMALARVLLQRPPLMLLDDALSAVDAEKEARIMSNLRGMLSDTTVLLSSHRTSVLRRCQRIVVMKAGQLVEDGAHDELLRQGGVYARLHDRELLVSELQKQVA